MTPDEARERFSDAYEKTLARGEQHAFDMLLQADPALREEYRAFVEVVEAASGLGSTDEQEVQVDLLPGLQERLRVQSGGRFYRDRFAQRPLARTLPLLVLSAFVVLSALVWFAFEAGLF